VAGVLHARQPDHRHAPAAQVHGARMRSANTLPLPSALRVLCAEHHTACVTQIRQRNTQVWQASLYALSPPN
jgi:hypothetical protein